MEVSKVAPPHISRLNSWGARCAVAAAIVRRSYERTRVARSDW